ncbi:translocation/assembly module TamB domain-containing protein [Bizionia sediminis]|uniref:Translocation/assembly module TamB domain-containing protein n=1 Tax=Bizionia sediminis TaxID=1737064 RepID=A0ABW5KRQ0_9FLAO
MNKAVTFIANKTETKLAVEKLFITFDGDVQLDNLYLEDKQGDTLIYSKSLEVNVPIWALVRGNGIGVDALKWDGLRANIIRKDTVNGFNFQFLINAFSTPSANTPQQATANAKPLNLILGSMRFKHFDVVYNDAVTGINSRIKFDELVANMEETNLESLTFQASKLALTNSQITFLETHKTVPNTNETSALPLLGVKKLTLNHVSAFYKSIPNGIDVNANISRFSAKIPSINLTNRQFLLDAVQLNNSKITLNTQLAANELGKETQTQTDASLWPNMQLEVGRLQLENNSFKFTTNNQVPKAGVFNPLALDFSDIQLNAQSILLQDKKAQLQLNQASFNEISGLKLKNLIAHLQVSDTDLNLEKLELALNKNLLEGNVQVHYPALQTAVSSPEQAQIVANFPTWRIALQDLFLLQPSLQQNTYLNQLSKHNISGKIKVKGNLADITFKTFLLNWHETNVAATGTLKNITNPDQLAFNITAFSAETKRDDVTPFINSDSLEIYLPNQIRVKGDVVGNLNRMAGQVHLTSSQGSASVKGRFENTDVLAFNAQVSVADFDLNSLLQNKDLGRLNMHAEAQGTGANINSLDAKLTATIDSFNYKNYPIKNVVLNGAVKNGTGQITSNYQDKNLNAELVTTVVLDSVAPQATAQVKIIGADLQALGILNRDIKTAMDIQADFSGNTKHFNLETVINDGIFVYDNKSYLLGKLTASAYVRPDTTAVTLNNKMADMVLQSNAYPEDILAALRHHVSGYFFNRYKSDRDSLASPVNLKLQGKISKSPILNEVFFVNLVDLDTIDVAVNFNEAARKLDASVTVPYINYNNLEVDNLAFTMNSNSDAFNFNLGFNEVTAGPLNIQKTLFSGNQTSSGLMLEFTAYQNKAILTQVFSKITGTPDAFKFQVQPDNLIINKTQWQVPDSNEMLVYDDKLAFNDFKFTKGNQAFEITDKLPNNNKDHIAVNFKNFKLHEFLSYLNAEEKLASGSLNGDLILEEPFEDTGILADLNIADFHIVDVNVGGLTVNAKSLGGERYDFHAHLKGGEIDLDLSGDYLATPVGANLDLNLDINRFNMTALTAFTDGELTETSGYFSGRFDVSGTTRDPEFTGNIQFNKAQFKVAKFNAAFSLKEETITVNNAGITMDNFTITDANGNLFKMTGKIGTQSYVNPSFNLNVTANDFQVLNATKEDNDFLYGKAGFNGTAQITGNLLVPKIKMNMEVTPNTNVTYVLPSAALNVEERDGVVEFVNRNNPNAILTRTKERTATVKGLDIAAQIKVNKETAVTLILDKETGDNFKVSGAGDFNVSMNPNGNLRLSGIYEVASGHYELNLYKIVNRKFSLVPGSRVSWSGDPFDAKLDVKAKYEVETSASSLMAPVYSGSDPAIKGKFRQVLPFYVYLNINGQLLEPEIAFSLDMPEEKQGAVGGQVFGRIQQLNNQEDELNRQVFSLLVLNRFYPDPGSDGSSGGVASIARNNLNDAVADQLNMFSDKLLGSTGFELDFGLNSYTDYQGNSPKQRTQLDIAAQKKLFDDRLIVRVGSEVDIEGSSSTGEDAPIIGNVSIEYLLTESGRYRLRGFSRNEFENVIDGQTVVSGIALIFTQEFNKYNELWDALFKSETKSEKEAKEQKEQKKQAAKTKANNAKTNTESRN